MCRGQAKKYRGSDGNIDLGSVGLRKNSLGGAKDISCKTLALGSFHSSDIGLKVIDEETGPEKLLETADIEEGDDKISIEDLLGRPTKPKKRKTLQSDSLGLNRTEIPGLKPLFKARSPNGVRTPNRPSPDSRPFHDNFHPNPIQNYH